jgi:hypothetical protein
MMRNKTTLYLLNDYLLMCAKVVAAPGGQELKLGETTKI